MAELFEYLAATDESEKVANRKAIVAATHRVTDNLGAFFGNAQTSADLESRLSLVKDDIHSIVEAACEEFGYGDTESVENAILRKFVANTREASTKESVRRPRLCPYHKQVVDISLAQGEPKAGYDAMAQHSWSKQHCESDEYGGDSCKFRPEMTTQSYWDNRSERNKEKREERERAQQEQQEQLHDTPEVTDEITEPIVDSEPTEISDDTGLNHDLESAPSAVATPEHEHEGRVGAPNQIPVPAQGVPPVQQVPPQNSLENQGIQKGNPLQGAPAPGVVPPPIPGSVPLAPGALGQTPQGQIPQVPGQIPPYDPNNPQHQQQYPITGTTHTADQTYSVEQLSDGSGKWKVVNSSGQPVGGTYDTQQEAQTEANMLNRGVSNQNQAELATSSKTADSDSNETGLGGPSPKIDKRKWTPQNLKQRVETEGADSPHPTKQIDPTVPIPANRSDDFLEGTRSQTETQTLPSDSSSTGFAKNNQPSGPKTKTFNGEGQANPVTSSDDNPLKEIMESEDFLPESAVTAALSGYLES